MKAPAVLFVSTVVAAASADYRWEPVLEPGCGGAIVSVEASPHNPDHLVGGGDMLGTCVSFDDGENWSVGMGLPSYEMAAVTFHPVDPDVVWIGSCMGPMKSTDGGRTWQWKRKGMPEPSRGKYSCRIEKVLFHPADTNRLYAFGGSHRVWGASRDGYGDIYESRDGGESWELKKSLKKDGKGENIIEAQFAPNGRLHLVTDLSGWVGHETPGHVTYLTFHPTDAKTVWITVDAAANEGAAFTPGAILKSTDGGRTWKPSDDGIRKRSDKNVKMTSRFSKVVVSPAAPDELYVCDRGWASSGFWKSTDGGASWSRSGGNEIKRACFAGIAMDMAAHPTRAGEIWAWNSEFYLRTRDGGKTWTDQTSVQPDPVNRPDHWRSRGWNGWCSRRFVFDPYVRGRSIALAMDAGHGWLTEDGMKSWRYTKSETNVWGGGNDAAFSKDGYVYVTTGQGGSNGGVLVSSDNGRTFHAKFGAAHGLIEKNGGGYAYVHALPEDGRRAWVQAAGRLYATEDGGENWKVFEHPAKISGFVADPRKSDRLYAVSGGHVLVAEDGREFRETGVTDAPSGLVAVDAKGRMLVINEQAREKSGLYRFDPADNSLVRLLDRRLLGCVATDPHDPARIVAGLHDYPYHDFAGGGGVLLSEDDGATWRAVNDGLPNLRVTAAAFDPFDPQTIVVGTGGTGFFRTVPGGR